MNLVIDNVPYEYPIIQTVDKLVDFAKYRSSPSKVIESESDWLVMDYIFKMFITFYPKDYKIFSDTQIKVKRSQKNTTASTKEGGARIQHQLNIPYKLYALMKAIYPNQQMNHKFVVKLAKRYPILGAGEKI